MINKLKNILLSIPAFLNVGKIPPNTPPALEEIYAQTNHLKSRKFFMTFCSVFILIFFYFSSIWILFMLSEYADAHINAFVIIFSKVIEILAVIIGLFLGAQTAVDLKYSNNSNTNFNSETKTNIEKKYLEEYMSGPKEKDYVEVVVEPVSKETK